MRSIGAFPKKYGGNAISMGINGSVWLLQGQGMAVDVQNAMVIDNIIL